MKHKVAKLKDQLESVRYMSIFVYLRTYLCCKMLK